MNHKTNQTGSENTRKNLMHNETQPAHPEDSRESCRKTDSSEYRKDC